MFKLFKFFTVVLVLSFSSFATEENPVFEQLKDDMWQMGLEFNYSNNSHSISPANQENTTEQMDIIEVEEVSRALYL